jgi:hypothetical protein
MSVSDQATLDLDVIARQRFFEHLIAHMDALQACRVDCLFQSAGRAARREALSPRDVTKELAYFRARNLLA